MAKTEVITYPGQTLQAHVANYVPEAVKIPYGEPVLGKYFDGYPQVIKEDIKETPCEIVVDKDVMVTMRDGIKIAIDVYRPEGVTEKLPVILCWGEWGKDSQDIVAWMAKTPQKYLDSPFWNGSIEGCDFTYTVPRGYIHVIAEPRGLGNSEGVNLGDATLHDRKDIYDTVEWIAAQEWCNGKVVMMGPSSYSRAQLQAGQEPAPHLVCIRPDEAPEPVAAENFTGIFDPILYNVHAGIHAYDQLVPVSYAHPEAKMIPRLIQENTPERVREIVNELCQDPDIKYSLKFYPEVKYPASSPTLVDELWYLKHPFPMDAGFDNIERPMYIGTALNNRLYEWGTFEAFRKAKNKDNKLIVYPPMFPSRPYAWYHDEGVRWFDYWVKGIDNGIMDEPKVKVFVLGINKWRFEEQWPPKDTQYTRYYIQPGGALGTQKPAACEEPDVFSQPAPYIDPTVYCLSYKTAPFEKDMRLIGEISATIEASIDIDDTNWMVDIMDVAPDGSRFLLSSGALKAKFKDLDETKTKPERPVHLRKDPVPVVPGEINKYEIALLPTANVFKAGHSMEVIIRNQDDMLGKIAKNGVYYLPFMQSVTHTVYFGETSVLVPLVED